MALTQDEVRALLAIAVAYDNRKPGEVTIAAWMEASERGRWTFPAAVEAIHEHYATSTQFLMPGHITAFVRAKMRLPAPVREVARLEGAQPAAEDARRRFSALIRARFSMPASVRQQRRAQRGSAEAAEARERARQELRARGPEVFPDDVVG